MALNWNEEPVKSHIVPINNELINVYKLAHIINWVTWHYMHIRRDDVDHLNADSLSNGLFGQW